MLPTRRAGLYEHVLAAAFSDAECDTAIARQTALAMAAWGVLCDRSQGRRFLQPTDDLPYTVLSALADETSRAGKVRLLRQAGKGFEFVHDQMHLYLAARWLSRPERSGRQIAALFSSTDLWKHYAGTEAEPLWRFLMDALDDVRLHELWDALNLVRDWEPLARLLAIELSRRGVPAPPAWPSLDPQPEAD